jgi:hypothetical protein
MRRWAVLLLFASFAGCSKPGGPAIACACWWTNPFCRPQTGAPEGTAYRVKWGDKEVDFDGFDQGFLLEAKGTGYAQWVDKNLNFLKIFKGRDQMLDQARRRFRAAHGTHVPPAP